METETTICKISIMMLRDHGHPYIQSMGVIIASNAILYSDYFGPTTYRLDAESR